MTVLAISDLKLLYQGSGKKKNLLTSKEPGQVVTIEDKIQKLGEARVK